MLAEREAAGYDMKALETSERIKWAPALPEKFETDYRLGEYDDERIGQVMWKYLVRRDNAMRAWVRINHHLPETLIGDDPLDILECSTAHGAMLEIWRDYGHRVVGTDFAWTVEGRERVRGKGVKKPWHAKLLKTLRSEKHGQQMANEVPGWPYQPIIESLGLDVRLFDGAQRPYPFEDKSFDIVCCYQAIEAYTGPEQWLDTVAEFCRIARKTVVIGFNPLPVERANDPDQVEAARVAWLAMQSFNAHGFCTSFFEVGATRRGMHPTVCKLVAV